MKQSGTNKRFFAHVAALNLMTGVAFALVLFPEPPPPALAAIAPPQPAPITQKPTLIPAVIGMPIHIAVPGVGVDLDVSPGSYDPSLGDWTLSYAEALHADSSMPINDSNGTTLIYAHALEGLFGSLPQLTPGMEAHITTDSGHRFRYRYQHHKAVSPSDTSVFTAKGAPTLVLQTCSGPWDTERSLYYFEFISEQAP